MNRIIEIGIQTRGYEDFVGDSNLLVGLGFLGKLTNNSNTGYKLYISSVIDALASKGIKMSTSGLEKFLEQWS